MNRIKLRENTFKLLYCKEFHDTEDMPKQYELLFEELDSELIKEHNKSKIEEELVDSENDAADTELPSVSEEDKAYITNRVDDIVAHQQYIDEEINKVAVNWSTDRMSKVDLTILRLAYYEMKMDDEIPAKVAVDQAVELAKKYGSDNSASFVNGILAKLF